jgi:long-chain acyl-CoA synthetase
VGLPIPGTQIRVVDPETREDLPDGTQGLLLAKGPGVMCGYYRDDLATAKVFTDGWFDTGDLGWRIPSNQHLLSCFESIVGYSRQFVFSHLSHSSPNNIAGFALGTKS